MMYKYIANLPQQRPYLIVSFATEGSEYVECCKKQAELYQHGYMALEVPCRGAWDKNTKIKPEVIYTALRSHEWVLWVDSDCTIVPPDELPEGTFDVGIVDNIHPEHAAKISAAFILFRSTRKTMEFMRMWLKRCQYSRRDHAPLLYALSKNIAKVENISGWLEGKHAINNLLPECDNGRPNRGVHYG